MRDKLSIGGWNRKTLLVTAGIIVSAVVVVSLVLWFVFSGDEETAAGEQYLKELEGQDVQAISENIDAVRSELGLELADNNADAIWGRFADAAILGDSRAVGFEYHEFLPDDRVLAKGGGKITDVPEYIEQLKKMAPKRIFLCYGLNDVGIGLWPEPADYVEEYEKQLATLAKELPDTTVYINSILPAVKAGLEADSDYKRIVKADGGRKRLPLCRQYRDGTGA